MKNRMKSLALDTVVLIAFLIVPAASPQMPARPGKLHLTSTPTGQKVIINKEVRPEVTEVTLIVSPGTYTVQVGDCTEQPVPVASGVTVEIHCP